MGNLNNVNDVTYEQLIARTHETESILTDVFNLVYDSSFLNPDEAMIKTRIKKGHEALEIYQAQLLMSLSEYCQKEEV